jgi:hypothetical protein
MSQILAKFEKFSKFLAKFDQFWAKFFGKNLSKICKFLAPLDSTRHPTMLNLKFKILNPDPSLYGYIEIYGYIEKEKVYNIEGQLRGLQGSVHPKTYAPKVQVFKAFVLNICTRT